MRNGVAGQLSGGHLPGRGTPVFGFDVQKRLFGGGVVGDGRLQGQPDALLDGGLRERAADAHRRALVHRPQGLHRRRETHAPRLFRVPVRRRKVFLGLDRSGREALAARLSRRHRVRFSRRAGRADALLLGLVQPVRPAERFLLLLLRRRQTHAPRFLRCAQQSCGGEGLPVLDRGGPNGPARRGVGRAKARRCGLLSSARCGGLLVLRFEGQRQRRLEGSSRSRPGRRGRAPHLVQGGALPAARLAGGAGAEFRVYGGEFPAEGGSFGVDGGDGAGDGVLEGGFAAGGGQRVLAGYGGELADVVVGRDVGCRGGGGRGGGQRDEGAFARRHEAHLAGLVARQEVLQRVPAAAHADHHVPPLQQLWKKLTLMQIMTTYDCP